MTTTAQIRPAFPRHARLDVRGAKSAADLLAAAGPRFDFRVEARPAMFVSLDGSVREAPGQVIVRTDTEEALSQVGPAYVPAQVHDFLAPLDPLLKAGALVPVSVASFDRGLHRAVELQLPAPIVLPGPNGTEDVLFRRLLWTDSLDGSSRLSLADALLRQWCKNGATHVIGLMAQAFKHTARKMAEAVDLFDAVEGASRRFAQVEQNAHRLLATPFTAGQMGRVAESLWPANAEGEVSSRAETARDAVVALFDNGTGTFGRSAWDAVNAVTEYATHRRPVRGAQGVESRLKSIWMGDATVEKGVAAVASEAGLDIRDGVIF